MLNSTDFNFVSHVGIIAGITIIAVSVFFGVFIGMAIARRIKRNYDRDKMEKTEKLFQTLSENLPVGIFRISTNGLITYVNPQWCELTGLTYEESLGRDWRDSIHPRDVAKLARSWKTMPMQGEKPIDEYRLVRKNGTIKWVIGRVVANFGEDGNAMEYMGAITDITELKSTEDSLRRSEESLKQSQLVAQMGDWEHDLKTNQSKWSENCFRLFALEPNEIKPSFEYFKSRVHPDDLYLIDEGVQKILKNKKPVEEEIRITFPDGSYKWILHKIIPYFDNDKLVRLQGIDMDITEFMKTYEKLSDQRKLFETMFNAMSDGVVVTNEKEEIILANKGMESTFGYRNDELIGKHMNVLCRKECPDKEFSTYDKLFNANYIDKNNQPFPGETFCTQLHDNNNKWIGNVRVIRNVTERVEGINALRKSEENYRNLFENHSVVKLMVEPLNGKIINANPAASKFYGWTVDQLKSMALQQITFMDKDEILLKLNAAFNRKSAHFEFSHQLADGSIRDVEIFTSNINFEGIECLHAIIHDVTKRKEAENQLLLLNKAIEQSPVSIFITNTTGEVEYINSKFMEVTGYNKDEAIGSKPYILRPGTHSEDDYRNLWDTISSGKDWSGVLKNKKKNGTEFWESIILSPMVSVSGEITNYIGIKEDITEQKNMIQEVIDAKERAEDADRLKSIFLANMSHEIRTPLNVILGYTNILTAENQLSADEKEEITTIINKGSDELLQVINDVLDASKLETRQIEIHKKPVDVQVLLNQLFVLFSRKIQEAGKAHIQLKLITPDVPVTVLTDGKRLFQIFSNLLNNSVKFTNEGMISFGINKLEDDRIEFIVSDTGIGIPKEARTTIFKHFRQAETSTTRLYGGAGLGLSIAKNLLRLMGGNIRFVPEKGKGTTFCFYILS